MHRSTVTHLVVCRPTIVGPERFLALCGAIVRGLEHAAINGDPSCAQCRKLDDESVRLRPAVQ